MSKDRKLSGIEADVPEDEKITEAPVEEETVEVPAETVVDKCTDPAINLNLSELAQIEEEYRGKGGVYVYIEGYRIPVEIVNKLNLGE